MPMDIDASRKAILNAAKKGILDYINSQSEVNGQVEQTNGELEVTMNQGNQVNNFTVTVEDGESTSSPAA